MDEISNATIEVSNLGSEAQTQNQYEGVEYEGVAPHDNMIFLSLDEGITFYKLYAKSQGFDYIKRTSKPFARTTELRYVVLCCNRNGGRYYKKKSTEKGVPRKNTQTMKCGCMASFSLVRKTLKDSWKTTNVRNDHNHDLVSPRSRCNLKINKHMPHVARNLVDHFSGTGLAIGKVPDVLDDPIDNFRKRDCYNHMRTVRKIILDVGDADSVFEYCSTKQKQDPNFYWKSSYDEEFRMTNFFWIDSRARLLYEEFGDVVVFDTTYKTNKYEVPFGLFVGVNNHNQSILFGCALLVNEQESSYEWLFRTWLDAMRGNEPVSILTDQDKAIGNMVKKVFPSSTHRLCLWHIMKKFSEKFGNLYKTKSNFKHDIDRCLYQTWSTVEFDKEWKETLARYELTDDEWLNDLFEIRSFWIPIYNRHVFFAGMATTQMCESMHAFFDGFVHKGTTLREFVTKYEKATLSRYIAENDENFKSKHKGNFSEKLPSKIAIFAASVYTRAILEKFLCEVNEVLHLTYLEKVAKNGSDYRYIVGEDEDSVAKFSVSISTLSWTASCECRLFEYQGILCRHILAIYHKKGMHKIPTQYILRRWTKEATDGIPTPVLVETNKEKLARNLDFHTQANLLLPYLHKSEKTYKIIKRTMKGLLEEVQKVEGETSASMQVEVSQVGSHQSESEHPIIGNPKIAITKGHLKDKKQTSSNEREKSGFEIAMEASKKRKRECTNCKKEGHTRAKCPDLLKDGPEVSAQQPDVWMEAQQV